MPKSLPKIALFTAPEGHWSISQAIEHTLQNEYQVHTHMHRDSFFNLYLPIYRFVPGAFAAPFELSKLNQSRQLIRAFLDQRYEPIVNEYLDTVHPDMVISTYYAYNGPLAEYAQKHEIPFINIVTDPRTFHPLIINPEATMNLVFDQAAITLAQQFEPDSHAQAVGWFVRPDFQQPMDKKVAREALGLDPDKLTYFIASGSEGSNLIMKIIPALFTIREDLQVIVACGSNKTLQKSVQALAVFLHQRNKNSTLQALGFTSEISPYFHAADLVIGKAGPNTLFESVATHTPFMAISHIAGQESGNLDIIREYKLGYVEENPVKATLLLRRITQNPDELNQWTPTLKKVAQYNEKTPDKLLQLCRKLL